MMYLQISAKKISDMIKVMQVEIDKNPDGFINIEFKSVDENSFVPAFSWSQDLDSEIPQFLKSGLAAIKKDDSTKKEEKNKELFSFIEEILDF